MANKYDVYNLNPLIIENIESTVTMVNDLPVTGRNYILNSQNASFIANRNVIQSVTVEKFDDETNMLHLVNSAGGSINSGVYIPQTAIKTGDIWSYSMDIKGVGVYKHVGINYSSTLETPSGNVKADWTRVNSSGVATKDNDFVVLYFNTKDTPLDVYIKLPKLETGNIVTKWTPAPEDLKNLTTIEGDPDEQNYIPITVTSLTPNTKYNLGVTNGGDSIFNVKFLLNFVTTKPLE